MPPMICNPPLTVVVLVGLVLTSYGVYDDGIKEVVSVSTMSYG